MAISVLKFMQERYPQMFKNTNMYAHQNKLTEGDIQAIRKGLSTYADVAAKEYKSLLDFQRKSGDHSEELKDSIKELSNVIHTMQSFDKGGKNLSADAMNKFFQEYRQVFDKLDPAVSGGGKSSYQEWTRDRTKDAEQLRKTLKSAQSDLADRFGDKFESVISHNAEGLGAIQGSILKVALGSLLGPGAPLLGAVDSLFDIDAKMAAVSRKSLGLISTGISNLVSHGKKKDIQDDNLDEAADKRATEEERETDRQHEENKSIWEQILTQLGIISEEKEDDEDGKKKHGLLGGLGTALMNGVLAPFKLLEKIPGFKMIERLLGGVGGLALKGGAKILGGVGTVAKGILGSIPGLGGLLGGGAATAATAGEAAAATTAAGVGGAAVGGEAAAGGGAMLAGGSMAAALPVLAGVAAVAAAGYGVYELYKHRKEVKDFLEKSGALKAAQKALDGMKDIASHIVSGIESIGSAIKDSGVIDALEKLGGAIVGALGAVWGVIKTAGGKLMSFLGDKASGMFTDIFSIVNGIFSLVGDAVNIAEASGIPQLIGKLALGEIKFFFSAIGGIIGWVADFVTAATNGNLGAFFGKTWEGIKEKFTSAMGGLADVFTWIATNVGPFIVSPLVNVIASVQSAIGGILTSVADKLSSGFLGSIISHIPGASKVIAGLRTEGESMQAGAQAKRASLEKAKAAGAANIQAKITQVRSSAAGAIATATPHVAAAAQGVVTATETAVGASHEQARAAGEAAYSGVSAAGNKLMGWTLGSTSAEYESGGKGAGAVSSGAGDHGGASYGTYQLESAGGAHSTLSKFLSWSGYGKDFTGLTPGTAAFNTKWKAIAKSDPNFGKAQHDFIKATHYDEQLAYLKKNGIDLSKRGPAVEDAVWSTAVQFGPDSDVIKTALKGQDVSKMSDAQIVKAIYSYKEASVATKFRSSSPQVQKSVENRFHSEESKLLALNKDYKGGEGTAGAPSSPGAPAEPMVASVDKPKYSRVTPMHVNTAMQPAREETEDVASAQKNTTPPQQGGQQSTVAAASSGGLSPDSIPSTISDEGLLILNLVGVA